MRFSDNLIRFFLITLLLSGIFPQVSAGNENTVKLANRTFQIEVSVNSGSINIKITDLKQNVVWADGPCRYELGEMVSGQLREYTGLELPKIERQSDRIRILGLIGGFEIQHDLILSADSPFLAEEMKIVNNQGTRRNVIQFHAAFSKRVTSSDGKLLNDFLPDHFQAVPFLHRADDPAGSNHDYTMTQIAGGKGFAFYTSEFTWNTPKRVPSRYFISEGWGWRHGNSILGMFSFSQDNMIFSSLCYDDQGFLHFGGFTKDGLNLSAMERFEPASVIYLGLNRFYPVSGDYNQIAYRYREMLDELGCRFPINYNPPVHWEEHFSKNMANGWDKRKEIFTRENIFTNEVTKAKEYSCQALYLDPGWDTRFGSLIWGEEWLGDCRDFVSTLKKEYGLQTSLHTPLSPWTTLEGQTIGPISTVDWPESAKRLIKIRDTVALTDLIVPAKRGPQICLASQQYLDEAEKRLLKLCEAGVTFMMFDGTYWNGSCEDANHGHPIPLIYEDNMAYCVELARRVHLKYPEVLIEMHDMLNGGHWARATPVYYKYGLPGSYDENWGFELMWKPFEGLKKGAGLAMYYYNLGCNVPLYLHIDLGQDNENGMVLWWYASTARHLGIGCSEADSIIRDKHREDMKRYIQLQDFFKKGDFYGINEEIHFHTLPDQEATIVNIFNLSDNPDVTKGSIDLEEIGLKPGGIYKADKEWITISKGKLTVKKEMKPWDADLTVIRLIK